MSDACVAPCQFCGTAVDVICGQEPSVVLCDDCKREQELALTKQRKEGQHGH